MVLDVRRERHHGGGIVRLRARLIPAHRGAFEHYWRTRLHLGLSEVGAGLSMSWGEAARITAMVMQHEPGSPLHAELSGWHFAASPEWVLTARLVALFAAANFEDHEKHHPPMPWDEPPVQPRAMPRERLMEILQRQRALPPQQRKGRVKVADS